MKQIIVVILGFCAIVLSSCSSEELSDANKSQTDEIIQIDEVELSELSSVQLQIDSLNQSMFPEVNSAQTRGLGKFFKKLLSIIVCDAVGGMFGNLYGGPVGAVGGAILSSGIAAFTPEELSTRAISSNATFLRSVNSDSISLANNIIPEEGANGRPLSKTDSIGYYHNAALIEMNQSLTPGELTLNNMTLKVAEVTASYYNIHKDTIVSYLNTNRNLFTNIINEKLFEASEDENIHDVISKWKNLYPSQTSQLDVLESFFNGISNLEVSDNDGSYLNRVLDIIESSSLSADIKQNLRNAFIVGNASYQLWNTEE